MDSESPRLRLQRFVEDALAANPDLTLSGLLDAANAWAREGHTHKGYQLWAGEQPFGPHYLAMFLQTGRARKLASPELRRQARFIKENPDRTLEDLERETRAAIRARLAAEEEKRDRGKQAAADKAARLRKAAAESRQSPAVERGPAAKKAGNPAALQRIVDFFRAAGIEATTNGRSAAVDGVTVNPTKRERGDRAKIDDLLDGLVWAHHREALFERIRARLPGVHGVEAGTNGWLISRHGEILAVIRATSAKVRSHPPRAGNYLSDEADWGGLAEDIEEISESVLQPTRGAGHRSFTHLPDCLPEPLANQMLAASRQLRRERNLVFDHAVELQYIGGGIRFEPLQQRSGHIEVPVVWSGWSTASRAELRINGTWDPLELIFRGPDDDARVAHGWALALIAYAQLVCRGDVAELLRPRVRDGRGARSHTAIAPRRPRTITSRPRARSPAFAALKPVGETRRWIASYVAGHRRRLQAGHQASSEATARASAVGIQLRRGETWVSPHVRGVPPDAVLKFEWHASTDLQDVLEEIARQFAE